MFDRYLLPRMQVPASLVARVASSAHLSANFITCTGFFIGIIAVFFISFQSYWLGLVCILLNRFLDAVDGELARIDCATDRGAYLDIVFDFIFYGLVVLGFGIASPEANALAACVLLASFMGTGSSFLAFAIMAEKRGMEKSLPKKGFYYLGGITEGFETILLFCLSCIWSEQFSIFAYIFAFLCMITTISRIHFACKVL